MPNKSRSVPHRAIQGCCGKYRQTSATQSNRTIVGNTGRPVPHRATGLLWEIQADQYHPKQQGCCGKYKLTCTTNSNMACCGKCKQISTTESNSSVVGNTSRSAPHKATGLVGNISRPVPHRATGLVVGNTSRSVPHRATGLVVGNTSRPVPHRATGLLWEIHADQDHTEQQGSCGKYMLTRTTQSNRACSLLKEIHTETQQHIGHTERLHRNMATHWTHTETWQHIGQTHRHGNTMDTHRDMVTHWTHTVTWQHTGHTQRRHDGHTET